jgi:hypothetical protein
MAAIGQKYRSDSAFLHLLELNIMSSTSNPLTFNSSMDRETDDDDMAKTKSPYHQDTDNIKF